mmetsp:Transcript_13639/g.47549  ORF Transcript_13639/g.47549 Transcript_13639/m.47549 type:complete len:103 (-) Transcript_13639:1170-1478(-)
MRKPSAAAVCRRVEAGERGLLPRRRVCVCVCSALYHRNHFLWATAAVVGAALDAPARRAPSRHASQTVGRACSACGAVGLCRAAPFHGGGASPVFVASAAIG